MTDRRRSQPDDFKFCRVCLTELIVNVTWAPSQAKLGNYICRQCAVSQNSSHRKTGPVTYEDLLQGNLSIEERRRRLEERQVDKIDGHWIWKGTKHKGHNSRGSKDPKYGYSGYGQMCIRGVSILAHRYSYMLYKGPIPEGHVIDQTCDIKACVNPDDLEDKTQAKNVERYYSNAYG